MYRTESRALHQLLSLQMDFVPLCIYGGFLCIYKLALQSDDFLYSSVSSDNKSQLATTVKAENSSTQDFGV